MFTSLTIRVSCVLKVCCCGRLKKRAEQCNCDVVSQCALKANMRKRAKRDVTGEENVDIRVFISSKVVYRVNNIP